MNNQIIIITILVLFIVGLSGFSAYLLLNQKNTLALNSTVNNTTKNNSIANNPTPNKQVSNNEKSTSRI